MRHGEHAVHGIADFHPGNGDRPSRLRHWRPSGRIWQATQRVAIAAALIGLGYGLAVSIANGAEAGRRVQDNLLQGLADEELPDIRPHDAEYWQLTFPRQVEEMINATISGGFQLVFYGDSITEQLRDLNGPCGLWGCPEGGEISLKHFGKWRSINMAIGGEPSWSMLYRMRNGALPGRDAGVRVVVIHTGTNDIGFDMGRAMHDPRRHADEIVKRIAAMAQLTRSRLPAVTVILLGIFPRHWDGGDFNGRQYAREAWPNPVAQVMQMVMGGLTVVADQDDKIYHHDCSHVFVVNGTLPNDLLPDGLHPSDEGRDRWAQCLADRVRDFMER